VVVVPDDDDLRFGDINDGDSDGTDSGAGGGFSPEPLLVGGIVGVVLLINQPLSSLIMNVAMALFLVIAGVVASFRV
jgi:hypothetical protein